MDNIYGFIDGTVRKICRPTYNQKAAYSGHKRHHAIKYQSVYLPDGMFMTLFGPIAGSRHDGFLFRESNLLHQMQDMFPDGEYALYGDPAYQQTRWLLG